MLFLKPVRLKAIPPYKPKKNWSRDTPSPAKPCHGRSYVGPYNSLEGVRDRPGFGANRLALAGRRPAQLLFWTQAEGAAKRSGAASRPGNEVFALLGGTGTGQCPVVGHRHHALIVRGDLRTKPGGGNALAIAYKRHARWQTLPGLEGRRNPTLAQGRGLLEPMEGSNQADARHGPLDRWKGQTQAGGGHRPLEPMEGSNQAGARHNPLDRRRG
jgi:hypothetical protein